MDTKVFMVSCSVKYLFVAMYVSPLKILYYTSENVSFKARMTIVTWISRDVCIMNAEPLLVTTIALAMLRKRSQKNRCGQQGGYYLHVCK
jgi:hypothetical protein